MKKIFTILAVILVVALVAGFFKDTIIKLSVEKGVEVVTGLTLKVKSFRVGLINTIVGIRGLRLFNPAGFKDKVMLDMPEIYVNYDLPAIIKGKIHLEEMRINMREFMVVKNENGELNLDSLKVVQAQKKGPKAEKEEKGEMPEIQIDTLELAIGKVVYKDYSRGSTPTVKEFNININERFTNITDPASLVSIIVVKALMNTTIANLTNFDLSGLSSTVSDTLQGATQVATEAVATAQKTLVETTKVAEQTAQKATETLTETTKTLEKTAEGLTDIFKAPFGSQEAQEK